MQKILIAIFILIIIVLFYPKNYSRPTNNLFGYTPQIKKCIGFSLQTQKMLMNSKEGNPYVCFGWLLKM